MPVIVFFDEMDSLFRTRGTGISSDVESTIVPQFLSEIDGVEAIAERDRHRGEQSPRSDRPGGAAPGAFGHQNPCRSADRRAAKEIFGKYLSANLPIHESETRPHGGDVQATLDQMIVATIEEMYSLGEENRFLEVTYANGDKEVLYFKDFSSGAMIESVVRRGKKLALKRYIHTSEKGIKTEDLLNAVREEFKENEELPQYVQPRRLGQDRRQEGRAHRLRQAPHRRGQGQAAPGRAAGDHGPVRVVEGGPRRPPPSLPQE